MFYRSDDTVELKVTEKIETIEEKIARYSEMYGVPYSRIYNTIECETAHTFDTNIQSNLRYDFSSKKRGIVLGEREQSYGLAQIHLPDHPEVTIEQATNPDFAIEFMAKNMSLGRKWWYCDK